MNHTTLSSTWIMNSSIGNITSGFCAEKSQYFAITVFLCLVFLVGFLLNSFSLWVFCCRMAHWSPGNVLQFHLALSDAIVSPAAPFMAAYFAMGSHWLFGQFLCKLKVSLLSTHNYGSVLFLMLISIQRCVTVVRYKQVSPMKRVGFVHRLCVGIWLMLLANVASCFALLGTSQMGNRTQCLSIHQGEYLEVYFTMNLILFIPGFLVPFSVAVACYARLAFSVSRIKANNAKGCAIRSRAHKMIAICLVIFLLCFLPINVVRTMAVVVRKFFPKQCEWLLQLETAYYVTCILTMANCCLNPLVYFFSSHKFTKALNSSLRKLGASIQQAPTENEGTL